MSSSSSSTALSNSCKALVDVKRGRSNADALVGRDDEKKKDEPGNNEIDDYYYWSQPHMSRIKRFKYFRGVTQFGNDWVCRSGLSTKEIYTSDDLCKALFDKDFDCARWMLTENPSLAEDKVPLEYTGNETTPLLHFLLACWSVLPHMRSSGFLSFIEWLIVEHPSVLTETYEKSKFSPYVDDDMSGEIPAGNVLDLFENVIDGGSPLHWWDTSIPLHILDLMIENSPTLLIRQRDKRGCSFLHRLVKTELLLESSKFDFRHVVSKCIKRMKGLNLLKEGDKFNQTILDIITKSWGPNIDLSMIILEWYIENIPEVLFWHNCAGCTPIHYLARHAPTSVMRRVLCLADIELLKLARHSSVPLIREVLCRGDIGIKDFFYEKARSSVSLTSSFNNCLGEGLERLLAVNHSLAATDYTVRQSLLPYALLPFIDIENTCYVLNEVTRRWKGHERHPITQVDRLFSYNGFHWLFVRLRLLEAGKVNIKNYSNLFRLQRDLNDYILDEWLACRLYGESDDSFVNDDDTDEALEDCASWKAANRSIIIPVVEKLVAQCPMGLFQKSRDGVSPVEFILQPSLYDSFKMLSAKTQSLIFDHWTSVPALFHPDRFLRDDLWENQGNDCLSSVFLNAIGAVQALVQLSGMSNVAATISTARPFILRVLKSQMTFQTMDHDLSILSIRIAPANARSILRNQSIKSLIQEERFQRLISAVMRLNKAGRMTYTHQTMNDRAFGVRILCSVKGDSVDDDNASLDGIFLFLRENPVLCNICETHYDYEPEEEESHGKEEKNEDHDCQRRYRQTTLDSWIVQR